MKIFSGSANKPLTECIAKELHCAISPIEMFTFPDGERRIQVIEKVIDEDCIFIQPASPPVDFNYMELFFTVDGLKRSGARSVTAVVPYFGYQRQDHIFRDGEAVSLEVIIKIIESVGVDRLISVDLHASRIPDLFHIPVNHLSALPIFAEKIKEITFGSSGSFVSFDPSRTVLISPDMGGIRRIKMISELLDNMPYVALEKNRDLDSGAISGDVLKEGSVEGKKIGFIIDDMVSSGKTIALAANVLKKMGLEQLYVFATHAVFSEDAPKILQEASVEKVYVTDTVYIPENKKFAKLAVLSIADIIAERIVRSK